MSWRVSFGFIRNTIRSKFPKHMPKVISLDETLGRKNTWVIEDVIVDTVTGYVFDKSKRFICESSSFSPEDAFLRMPALPLLPRKVGIESKILFLGAEAYYHWLIEDFPAFLRANEEYPSAKVGIRLASPKYVFDVLEILGITPEILPLYSKVDHLVLAKKNLALNPKSQDVEALETFQHLTSAPAGKDKKIYISRLESGRYPDNELEIQELFKDFGFKIVELSGTTFLNQISLFSGAEVVAGTHGAGLANIVWLPKGKGHLIEIGKKNQPDCFGQIARIKELNYSLISSESEGSWFVNLEQVKSLLTSGDA